MLRTNAEKVGMPMPGSVLVTGAKDCHNQTGESHPRPLTVVEWPLIHPRSRVVGPCYRCAA